MKPRPTVKFVIVFVLISGVFFVLNAAHFDYKIKNLFYSLSSPIQKSIQNIELKTLNMFSGIFQGKELEKEILELNLKNQELAGELVSLKEIKKENKELREALGLKIEKDFKLIFAQVISKDAIRDSILINKGRKDGVSGGMPAVNSQKVLVGRIGAVYEDFSEVVLITNKDSSFDTRVSETDVYGVLKGKGNFGIFFDLVPKEEEVLPGEYLTTTALGGIFPAGLFAGKIKEVKKPDTDSFQKIEVEPGFKLKELNNLFIIAGF